MRLVLLGPPGAGKGTQASLICHHFSIPQISTGDMLRSAIKDVSSDLGAKVRDIVRKGLLVPDDLIIKIVEQQVLDDDCSHGYLLDGIPRTVSQAQSLIEARVYLDLVVEIHVPDSIVVERLSGRLIHPASGRTYHKLYNPPLVEGCDDYTGEPLVKRDDDSADTVLRRLDVYHEHNKQLVEFYQNVRDSTLPIFFCVDGLGPVDVVFSKILSVLEGNVT